MNHQLESRMRENRQSGSEGGGTKPIASPYPYEKESFGILRSILTILLEARVLLNQLFLTIAREADSEFCLVARALAAQH